MITRLNREKQPSIPNPRPATRPISYMPPIRSLYAGPVIEYHNHGL
jgi:hypothetical protein